MCAWWYTHSHHHSVWKEEYFQRCFVILNHLSVQIVRNASCFREDVSVFLLFGFSAHLLSAARFKQDLLVSQDRRWEQCHIRHGLGAAE